MNDVAHATPAAEQTSSPPARVWPGWLTPLLLALIVAVGFALRVAGSRAHEYLVDEGFSLLAGQTVSKSGLPLLPSGVLYLHGTIQSYLLAPLMALGLDPLDDLFALRLVSALAGAVAIVLAFLLGRTAGGPAAASLFAAALVAVDPASVLWGGYVRMYALAQPLAVAVAIAFLLVISERPGTKRGRTLIALVLLFWLAVFTHLATALLWPAMAAVAIVVFGPELLRGRRDLSGALALCVLAPLVLVGLTGAIGPGAGTTISGRSEGLPGVSFLGEDNVNLAQVLQPDPSSWTALFAGGPLALLMPLLLALASGVLIGHVLLGGSGATGSQRRSTGALLALYWLPILALALFASDAAERYAIFLLPIGYVLLALAATALTARLPGHGRSGWAIAGGAVLAGAVLLHGLAGDARMDVTPSGVNAARPAEAFVAAHRAPGELILTSVSVDTALLMGPLPELRYLPGGEGSQRALRYTRYTDDGQAIDYWVGMPSLATTDALCSALRDAPGSWVMLGNRIWQNWGYNDLPPRQMERRAETMRQLVLGLADQAYEDEDTIIFRTRPADAWSNEALAACKVGADPERKNRQQRKEADATPSP